MLTQLVISSDMWAIGVITYFLLCGYTPFERENNIDEMNAIMHADYTFDEQYWSGISEEGTVCPFAINKEKTAESVSICFISEGFCAALLNN